MNFIILHYPDLNILFEHALNPKGYLKSFRGTFWEWTIYCLCIFKKISRVSFWLQFDFIAFL